MTTEHGMGTGTVHEVRWRDALPWWIIFRAAGAAFGPTVILLAGLGSLATWAGWSLADRFGLAVADPTAAVLAGAGGDPLVLPPPQPRVAPGQPAATALGLPAGWLTAAVGRLPPVAAELARLVRLPFDPRAGVRDAGGGLVRLGWFVLVWSIFGTAITRRVALSLVSEDVPGLTGALWYGTRKWLPAFNSFLFVLLGIAVLSVPGALLGLLMRADVGVALAGAVWPLVLAGAAVLAILLVGVVAGWPLMVAAVGVERGDSFQAISTAFSYLYQRPLHYAFYATVAAVVAVPAMAMASLFGGLTVTLADWAASFGMGHGGRCGRLGWPGDRVLAGRGRRTGRSLRLGPHLGLCHGDLPAAAAGRGRHRTRRGRPRRAGRRTGRRLTRSRAVYRLRRRPSARQSACQPGVCGG